MALVTNPYATSSPPSSYSDDGNTDDEEATKVNQSRLKGTATLMLGSNKRLRASCEEQHLNSPGAASASFSIRTQQQAAASSGDGPASSSNDGVGGSCDSFEAEDCEAGFDAGDGSAVEKLAARADGVQASRPASSCSSGSCSSSSEIQQHLQSMFSLLRPEETLKMAVKLESLRPGRTRYLVVVSRSVSSKRHSTYSLLPAGSSGNLNSSSWPSSTGSASGSLQSSRPSSVLSGSTARLGSVPAGGGEPETSDARGYAGALGVDTFVSSLENCLLSNAQQPSQHTSGGSRQGAYTSCKNDECDSKANTRLSSDTAVAETGTASHEDACGKTGSTDMAHCVGGTSSLVQPQHFQQSSPSATSASNCTDGGGPVDSGKEIEESCLLGIDCNERTTVGLVLKVLADTSIRLDGDGGFSVSSCGKQHIFKPVSVQAMWSALQTLHKVSSKAREHNFFAGGPSHDWVCYYEAHIDSDRSCLNEWNAMDSLESRRPPSPGSIRSKPTKREETESVIRSKLKEVMMSVDLDDVTSKFIRGRLEELLDMDLGEYKPFIDGEMLVILGQMDAPTEIFDHVYLGSEWNASNLEELQRNGVRHILNVTREIDNFFPGLFNYFNVRVYDDEKTDLLRHWDNTFKYISRAKMEGSKVLVHCKMGISRSASVVIAYAMKANNWDFEQALRHVKEKRNCIKPNKNFLMQLETYQGMLDAMKNKEKLQRSKSETNLKLAGAKEGRSLPGSEPTPLIQALSGAGGGSQSAVGGKRHTVASGPVAELMHGKMSTDDSPKAGDDLDEPDRHTQLHGSDESCSFDELETASQGMRGRTRTRQHQNSQQQHQRSSPSQFEQHQEQEQQSQDGARQRPSFCEGGSWRGVFSHPAGHWGEGNHRARQSTQAGCTSVASSRATKRHKSLSPDTLHPRWVSSHETATLTASLGLQEPAEPVVPGRGASEPRASRRKQQSYSLEHLHGLLEMRSPCAETKTIRMPCGNGQNYSVSPNQIVHLQDRLPKVRDGVRNGSFLRQIFPSHYNTTTTNSTADETSSTQGAAGDCSTTSSSSTTSACSVAPSSTANTTTTTTVPSSSASVSSVKTIVCELESSSSSSNRTSISHIPVAPPPSTNDSAVVSAAIPIASIAAEAAAVAVASRKEQTTTSSSSANPASISDGSTICWTSSAQIIQTAGFTFPERLQEGKLQVEVEVKEAKEEEQEEQQKEDPATLRQTDNEDGEGARLATVASGGGESEAEEVRRQEAEVVEQECGQTNHHQLAQSNHPELPQADQANGEPSPHATGASVRLARITTVSGEGDTAKARPDFPADRGEDIPWHPGTVKRTKEKIEERSSSQAASSTRIKRTGSSCSGEHVDTAKTTMGTHTSVLEGPIEQHTTASLHRGRRGMVSTNYARLSASAPDSYNMYAGTSGRVIAAPAADSPATSQLAPSSSSSSSPPPTTTTTADSSLQLVRFRTSIHGRASISTGGCCFSWPKGQPPPRSKQQPGAGDGEPPPVNQPGKVRNLKMSFEAKSHDRRREQKKVRSLPSSPVAVHAQLTTQPRAKTQVAPQEEQHPSQPKTSTAATTAATPSTNTLASSNHPAGSPLEDVTVRDLVDRYEIHGPRTRTTSNGGAPPSVNRQRPRSVFEPLKSGHTTAQSQPSTITSGLLFNAGKTTPHLISHATAPLRVEEFSRPPVPPAVPFVRGLLVLPADSVAAAQLANNNNSAAYSLYTRPGATTGVSSSNTRNNNLPAMGANEVAAGLGVAGEGSNRKRAQQHGRTHPLAKISPSNNAGKQQQQQQQQQQQHHQQQQFLHHHHHHHHHHHQYSTLGQLQQHRLATGLVAPAQAAAVSGGASGATTAAANAYNTM